MKSTAENIIPIWRYRKESFDSKYTAENGIVATLAHFAKDNPDNLLKESMVRGWKKELARRNKNR